MTTPSRAARSTDEAKPKSAKPKTAKQAANKTAPPKAATPKTPTAKAAKTAGTTGSERATGEDASRLIDRRIEDLGGWRGETLARMRALILDADPGMTEEWKWMGTPVWSHHGNVCTGETYKTAVKLTFPHGASLPDPSGLFNASLEGGTRRAIDIHEGEQVEARAFKALVKAAVARNAATAKEKRRKAP